MSNLFGNAESVEDTKSKFVDSVFKGTLPWEYKWSPSSRKDLILPETVSSQIEYQLSTTGLKNTTFCAGPGVGKTTLALLIAKELNWPIRFYNASQMKVDTLRDEILPCGLQYVSGPPTIIVLDECDRAGSTAFWDSLRNVIDRTLTSLRFILTGNNSYNIPEPILSRCPILSFEHTDDQIKRPIFNRLLEIVDAETKVSGGTVDKKTVADIARHCYPDIRRTINELERNFDQNHGSIKGTPRFGNTTHFSTIYKHIIDGDDIAARVCFNTNVNDYTLFFTEFCDYVQEHCDPRIRWEVGVLFAEYNFRASMQVNQELNMTRGLFGQLIILIKSISADKK
jgi:hypothetical protein